MLTVAVSRLKAKDPAKRKGAIVVNPGGPGGTGITYPLRLTSRGPAPLNTDFDLIGFDPRGVGYSDRIDCDVDFHADLPPTATDQEFLTAIFDANAKFNEQCAAKDPDFVQQLTTANVARDVDSIRAAMGEQNIGFYGASWGTALGAEYRTLFDSHVSAMWLDSVMPPSMNLAAMDDDVADVREKRAAQFFDWLSHHDAETTSAPLPPRCARSCWPCATNSRRTRGRPATPTTTAARSAT
ncbi:alpha/beta fold hydrolase [Amycolatopsis sp. FDAARGOS 1241]|uniref:alpha/beta fold hydrolase n=1 Tax=Amycolatopsis sp. FDAARGOS 1241 TaxID=2778070 RepID=UPI001952632F|nr:alpha/beta fold hydrolase [Amycolatopsis sp. FDAARGOS 1241]QRP47755.1 alpha/beta fold hydrolase [Amycolatopsis sp. FDAARGOS 1241]